MIAGNQGDGFNLIRFESPQVAVLDEVVRVLVMTLVADVYTDVVEQRGVFKPLPLAIGQPVKAARLIEQSDREAGDLLRVLGPVVAPLGKLEHAAAPHVGVAIRLDDFLAVASDVVEHEPLAQRQIAQRDVLGPKTVQDQIEQDSACHRDVRTARLETGYPEALLQIAVDQSLARPPQLLGRNPSVA